MGRLNSGTILLAFVAIMFGLAGTYALRTYLRQPAPLVDNAPQQPNTPERITVPLASRDIPSGTEITMDDVALYRMTRDEIKNTLQVNSFMTNPDQIVGKILLRDLRRGRTFNTQDFYPSGSSPGISGRLKPGLRALTLMLDPTSALMGYAGPGQYVDVLFHYGTDNSVGHEKTAGDSAAGDDSHGNRFYPQHHDFNPPRHRDYYGNTIGSAVGGRSSGYVDGLDNGFSNATVTLVQNAEVMALGRKSQPTATASGVNMDELVAVTLAVRPREAELLRVASGHGALSLTLRSPSDGTTVELLNPVTLNEIIDVKSQLHNMVIHRGKSVSKLKFAGGVEVQKRVFNQNDSTLPPSGQGTGAHPTALPVHYGSNPSGPRNAPAIGRIMGGAGEEKNNHEMHPLRPGIGTHESDGQR